MMLGITRQVYQYSVFLESIFIILMLNRQAVCVGICTENLMLLRLEWLSRTD